MAVTHSLSQRCGITAVVGLIGVAAAAVTSAAAVSVSASVSQIQLASGDESDIVIDIVRHAEDLAPANSRVPFSPEFPGAPLSELGRQQAQDTANQLVSKLGGPGHISGLFSGPDLDAQETAAPFATLQDMIPQILPGLVEVDGGVYANLPISSPGGILYDVAVVAWTLGIVNSFQIPGASEFNGVLTNDRYTDAIEAMYSEAMAHPVVSANGHITDVAFSSEASTMIWVLNNVKNPDISVLISQLVKGLDTPGQGLPEPLPNAGVVEIQGNPEDGWTLVSWAGQPVSKDPGVLTDLFILWRDLILPPQTAAYHIYEALLSGDPATISGALQGGIQGIGAALEQIPGTVTNMIDDIAAGNW